MRGLWSSLEGLLSVLVAMGSFFIVVGDAVVELWGRGDELLAILAAVGFPITFIIWPWRHEAFGIPLWIFFVAGVVSYFAAMAVVRRVGSPSQS